MGSWIQLTPTNALTPPPPCYGQMVPEPIFTAATLKLWDFSLTTSGSTYCFGSLSGWPRSGWPLSTTLCYKSVTGLNHHTDLLLIFYMVGSDIRKKYWKFHNDNVNSFGVMGKGNAIFQPYFRVTMSHFKFSYFLNSCPHKIEVPRVRN